MPRLSRYLQKQFFAQALTIFAAGALLIWLMQLLRLFDIVSAKGQNFFTLMGQSALTTPTFARSILYVCFAIGLARAFRAMQASRELHTIHAAQRTGAQWHAVAVFTVVAMASVGLVAHWIEPKTRQTSAEWSAEIAADLVGQALIPGRFSEVENGLIFSIADRRPDGTLVEFFFDDTTNADTRRTYFAETARVFEDEAGFQLILYNGAIQYEGSARQSLSQIRFTQYHISLSSLIEAAGPDTGLEQIDSITLIGDLLNDAISRPDSAVNVLHGRFADMLRAVALCVFAAAVCGFPDGRRRSRKFPIELGILMVAFGEQAISAFAGGGAFHYVPPSVLLLFSLLLLWRKAARASLFPSIGRQTA
ncbi:LptF/LptG family permease [Pelagibacterium lentulum]|nr:LptF/LptG family permease [Pelagibacterium lentulum]